MERFFSYLLSVLGNCGKKTSLGADLLPSVFVKDKEYKPSRVAGYLGLGSLRFGPELVTSILLNWRNSTTLAFSGPMA